MDNGQKYRVLSSDAWMSIRDDNLEYISGGLTLKTGLDEGTYYSEPFDSGITGCRWHRIYLDAEIPDGSMLIISFSTSDKEETKSKSYDQSISFTGVKDALIQTSKGRYLSLKIVFYKSNSGNGVSPVLKRVIVYYPRITYLRYLPVVYQEDEESRDFLERFLSIFETVLNKTEKMITDIPVYLDPEVAPGEFIPWLSSWVSLDLYELLHEKNREFILRANDFYKMKGTVRGIAALVSFLTGIDKCCVKEYANNIFRTYGMDHTGENELEHDDDSDCNRFFRKLSRTVDTNDRAAIENIGTYYDDTHYVTDTSIEGLYKRNVVGIFIFCKQNDMFIIKEDELHKIINSFLPVFIDVRINIIDAVICEEEYRTGRISDPYYQDATIYHDENIIGIAGSYIDKASWEILTTYLKEIRGLSNDRQYRTWSGHFETEKQS